MRIHRYDVQRQEDRQQLFEKAEEILKEVNELKDQLVKVIAEQEVKKKYLINKTQKIYEERYSKL